MADPSKPNTIVRRFPVPFFEATPSRPSHFSVGAIPIRENEIGEIEVLVHYFEKTPEYPVTSSVPISLERVYKLMTETPNIKGINGRVVPESKIAALRRGLIEEFGVTGIIDKEWKWTETIKRPWYFVKEMETRIVTKRTDYYIVRNVAYVGGRDYNSPEGQSELKWVPLEELINKMSDQAKRYPDIPDADESMPLIRLWVELDLEKQTAKVEKESIERILATLN